MWTVYIILTKKDRLYTGITTDPERRFQQHLEKKGAKFFYSDPPKKILYTEIYKNRSEATKREMIIKKMNRIDKLKLVSLDL